MDRWGKVIGLTILITNCLCYCSDALAVKTETFVSKAGSKNFLQEERPELLLVQQVEDSTMGYTLDSLKLKNPDMAMFYAFVPGIIIHGSGHFYAGEKTTGWVLVGGEVLSLCLLTYAVGVGIGESTNGSTSNGEAEIVSIFAGSLFVGSWIYDVVGAPLAVQRNRQKLREKSTLGLQFNLDLTTQFMKFQIAKRF